MTITRRLLQSVVAPALPLAPKQYEDTFFNRLNAILRLYFNRIDAVISAILDVNGGALLNSPYGAFYNNAIQTFGAANTPTVIVIGSTQGASGMSLAANKITFDLDGLYNITFALQFYNTSASIQDATFWLRKNGVDIPNSSYAFTVTEKHGAVDGKVLSFANFGFSAVATDYVEIVGAVSATTLGLYYEPAQTVPYAHPSVPSTYVTITFISAV
jgi:hypothetical protein